MRRARIEHLMAELANSAPSPVVEQPNIMNALKGSNKKAERVIMHLVKTGRCLIVLAAALKMICGHVVLLMYRHH